MKSILNNAYANYERSIAEEQYTLAKVIKKFSENKFLFSSALKKSKGMNI